ncbi:MAG TPA: alpha-amylase, partial [Pirellulales bacterium]|nr:alpha-amylase [Pirellulales bacterium]
MGETLRLVLVLHQHQPVGNLDAVVERIYRDSYLPTLAMLERCRWIRVSLHTSGPLLAWLGEHHPDYLERLTALAASGQVD